MRLGKPKVSDWLYSRKHRVMSRTTTTKLKIDKDGTVKDLMALLVELPRHASVVQGSTLIYISWTETREETNEECNARLDAEAAEERRLDELRVNRERGQALLCKAIERSKVQIQQRKLLNEINLIEQGLHGLMGELSSATTIEAQDDLMADVETLKSRLLEIQTELATCNEGRAST